MNIGGGIGIALGILALLTGLAAVATFIALGTQRGRVERLENRNSDLEKEIGDEKRRHDGTRADLQEVSDRATRQQSIIDQLKGEVHTLSTLPLEAMSQALNNMAKTQAATEKRLDAMSGQFSAHHREAMFGQETQLSILLDIAHMLGDKRNRQTIAQAMRASGRNLEHE